MTLTKEAAEAVYDVLVEFGGADEEMRYDFVHHQTDRHCPEYRFQGLLGFGGKFRRMPVRDCPEQWYVDCYSEDVRPGTRDVMDRVNAKLSMLQWDHEPSVLAGRYWESHIKPGCIEAGLDDHELHRRQRAYVADVVLNPSALDLIRRALRG